MERSSWSPPSPGPGAPLLLVVEDDPDAQQVATAMLHMIGYQTRVVGDGHQAIAALQRELPAAVLLDLHMPGLDGLAFLDTARREVAGFKDIPVIATSAVYRDEEALIGPLERRRVLAFVAKPFSLARLKDGLKSVIQTAPPMPLQAEPVEPVEETSEELAAETMEQEPSEERFECYIGAAAFFGREVGSVTITEIGPSGFKMETSSAGFNVGDELRVRGHVDIPGRSSDGLLDLRLKAEVAWRMRERGKVILGMDLTEIQPAEGFATLLSALSKQQKG